MFEKYKNKQFDMTGKFIYKKEIQLPNYLFLVIWMLKF